MVRTPPDTTTHVMATELFAEFSRYLQEKGMPVWSERTFIERFAEHEDQDDEDETGGAAGGTEDELPLTGSAAAQQRGGAVLLLGLGTGAYLVARRRRVSFSA